MNARTKRRDAPRSRSERPYLRAVHSLSPNGPKNRRPGRVVKNAVSDELRRFDPLAREPADRGRRIGVALGYWFLALVLHGAAVTGLVFFGRGETGPAPVMASENTFVEIRPPAIQEPSPSPPKPEPVLPEAPPVAEETVVKRAESAKKPPKPRRAPAPAPAASDPVDMDAPSPSPNAAARRKVVGISFESTVTGGPGPAFAVGNTRMGETLKKAESVTGLAPLPRGRSKGEAGTPNRVAQAIPTAGVSLVKPARKGSVPLNYPELLKSQGIEGNVVVLIRIDTSGAVINVTVIKGSGYAEFDTEAKRAARKERFSPATRNGEPIEYTLKYTYRFRVRES
jgi:periplasmic protein TonB